MSRFAAPLPARAPPSPAPRAPVPAGGQPLAAGLRAQLEPALGFSFERVRVHAGPSADAAARAAGALAYAYGPHLVFRSDAWSPQEEAGMRLLRHELVHTAQQGFAPPLAGDARPLRRTPGPLIQRQTPASGGPSPAVEAAEYLGTMADYLNVLVQTTRFDLRGASPPLARVHAMLNQGRVSSFLQQASSVYRAQTARLPAGAAARRALRAGLIRALGAIRAAAALALSVSDRLPPTDRDPERSRYAENMAAWIEASPMSSAALSEAGTLGASDVTDAAAYETEVDRYLADLEQNLPGLGLSQAARDPLYARIQRGVRRASVTVGTGPSGAVGVAAISGGGVPARSRRVMGMLSAGMSAPSTRNVLTERPPTITLPDPVPDVSSQLSPAPTGGTVDLSHVPAAELPSVRYDVLQIARTVFPSTSTSGLRDAVWPLSLPVRLPSGVVRVRYELYFDPQGNIRPERLGEERPREVSPAFTALSLDGKKAQLVADFGLSGVLDRPAARGRTAATWTDAELVQVKAAFEILSTADRAALRGVGLVRDHLAPGATSASAATGTTTTGYAHTGADRTYDQPGPPAVGPPHIHYYDAAFAANGVTVVGPAGASGPGGDWTLLHEVGHMEAFLPLRQANAASSAANTRLVAANGQLRTALRGLRISAAQRAAFRAWHQAALAVNTAVLAFNTALVAANPPGDAQLNALVAAVDAAVATRDPRRTALSAAGLPQPVLDAATEFDAANGDLYASNSQRRSAARVIPTFVALATRFGFPRFTDYARSGGDGEWFAETFALYANDPDRLNQMSRNLYLWFAAGRPNDPSWSP